MRLCPCCGNPIAARFYLCRSGWAQLPDAAKKALNRKDGLPAARRLAQLRAQLNAGVALTDIEITEEPT